VGKDGYEESFFALRGIVGGGNEVLRAMLYGKMKESSEKVIPLPGDIPIAFNVCKSPLSRLKNAFIFRSCWISCTSGNRRNSTYRVRS